MSNTDRSHQAYRGTWRPLRISFDMAAERLPKALQAEEFGVITQIDLQQTFKAKLQACSCHATSCSSSVMTGVSSSASSTPCNSSTSRAVPSPSWLTTSARAWLAWRRT
jgi:hypothetical protein